MLIALASLLALAPQAPLTLALEDVLASAKGSYGDFRKRSAESSDGKVVYDLTFDNPNTDTTDVMRVTFYLDPYKLVKTYEVQYEGRPNDASYNFGSFLGFFERACFGHPGSADEAAFVASAAQRASETGRRESKEFGNYRLEVEGGNTRTVEAASDLRLTMRLSSADPRVPSRCIATT
ncbi:hypothetical protein [Deinococcus yavapaiensis]|uniref:Uncharacterized protein n=1 Tax=Deinococcus yavapaiensis KR-236 TaxID=694435 RepID=A0A318S699_9DEIO|nr:hypothetical protein [Deinococcus yavapaiensis]PYE53152.1 hypothetical protein DES52_110136 [Deinococcus yavapaiensis KR-236]